MQYESGLKFSKIVMKNQMATSSYSEIGCVDVRGHSYYDLQNTFSILKSLTYSTNILIENLAIRDWSGVIIFFKIIYQFF